MGRRHCSRAPDDDTLKPAAAEERKVANEVAQKGRLREMRCKLPGSRNAWQQSEFSCCTTRFLAQSAPHNFPRETRPPHDTNNTTQAIVARWSHCLLCTVDHNEPLPTTAQTRSNHHAPHVQILRKPPDKENLFLCHTGRSTNPKRKNTVSIISRSRSFLE